MHAVFKFNLDLIFTSWRGHKIVTFFSDQYSDGYHFVNSISTKTTALTPQYMMSMNSGGIVVLHAVFKFNLNLIFTS